MPQDRQGESCQVCFFFWLMKGQIEDISSPEVGLIASNDLVFPYD